MKSKIIQKSIITLFFISAIISTNAQDQDLVNLQFTLDNLKDDITYYDGQINLKNDSIINGRISLNHLINKNQYSVLLKTDEGCTYISNKNLSSVILYDKDIDKTTETKFIYFEGHDKLLRQLYIKDLETAIYDSMEKPFDNAIMSGIFVFENQQLTYIHNFWSSGPKKDIIDYINKRDGSNYKRSDFKSLGNLFTKL